MANSPYPLAEDLLGQYNTPQTPAQPPTQNALSSTSTPTTPTTPASGLAAVVPQTRPMSAQATNQDGTMTWQPLKPQSDTMDPDAAVAAFGYAMARNLNASDDKNSVKVRKAGQTGANLLTQFGDMYGLSDNSSYLDLVRQFDATSKIYESQGDDKGMQEYAQQFTQQLPTILTQLKLQADTEKKAAQEADMRQKRQLAMQAQFAPIFKGIVGTSQAANQSAYDVALHAADTLKSSDPTLAALISSNAASSRSNNDALLAAYAAQIAMTPVPTANLQGQEQVQAQYDNSQMQIQQQLLAQATGATS